MSLDDMAPRKRGINGVGVGWMGGKNGQSAIALKMIHVSNLRICQIQLSSLEYRKIITCIFI